MTALTLLRSRKLICPFSVHAPASVAEAVALKTSRPHSAYMAGGIDLADRMKSGAGYSDLIRLDAVPELTAISAQDGWVHIGAAVAHRLASQNPLVWQHLPFLAAAIATIGSPRIRTQGTIGGNIMSGVAHYDVRPILIALSAKLVFAADNGARHEQEAHAPLPESGLLLSIAIPAEAGRDFHFQRVDKPVLSLSVALRATPSGEVKARVVLACPGQDPILREFSIEGRDDSAIIRTVAAWRDMLPLQDDRVSSAWYRAELAGVRLRRLLQQAVGGRQ